MYQFITEAVEATWLGRWVYYRLLFDDLVIGAGFSDREMPQLWTELRRIFSGISSTQKAADIYECQLGLPTSLDYTMKDERDQHVFLSLIRADYMRRLQEATALHGSTDLSNLKEQLRTQISGEIRANWLRVIRLWREEDLCAEPHFSPPVEMQLSRAGLTTLRDLLTSPRAHMLALLNNNFDYLLELQMKIAEYIIGSITKDQKDHRPYLCL